MKMERNGQARSYKDWYSEFCFKVQWEIIEGFFKQRICFFVVVVFFLKTSLVVWREEWVGSGLKQ